MTLPMTPGERARARLRRALAQHLLDVETMERVWQNIGLEDDEHLTALTARRVELESLIAHLNRRDRWKRNEESEQELREQLRRKYA